MKIDILNLGAFSIISAANGGRCAAVVTGGKIGPLFRTATDAVDWAYDTECGASTPADYDTKPVGGLGARVVLAILGAAYAKAQAGKVNAHS
jgi:hypothetical protein